MLGPEHLRTPSIDPLQEEFRQAILARDSGQALRAIDWGLPIDRSITIPRLFEPGSGPAHLPLTWAVKRLMPDLVAGLLQRKADATAEGAAALRAAEADAGAIPLFEQFLRHGSYRTQDPERVGVRIIENDDIPYMRAFLRGTTLDKELKDGLLRHAVRMGFPGIAKLLIDEGADVNCFHGFPLQIAFDQCDAQSAKGLLDRGARIEFVKSSTPQGFNPQRVAQWRRFEPLLRQVVTPPAHVFYRDHLIRNTLGTLGVEKEVLDSVKLQGSYTPSLHWSRQPIIEIALGAAYTAALIGRSSAESSVLFVTLLTNDVKRIASTPGLTWSKYSGLVKRPMNQVEHFGDVLDEVSTLLVYPILAKRAPAGTPLRTLQAKSSELAARLVLVDKSTLDITGLTDQWHKPGARLPSELVPIRREATWKPLFEPCLLDSGLKVLPLTSPQELLVEGTVLDHCVGRGGYAEACAEGRCHIISIRRGDEPIATIELREPRDGRPGGVPDSAELRLSTRLLPPLGQFHGRHNGSPPQSARAAWTEFLHLVDTMKVEILDTTPAFVALRNTRPEEIGQPAIGYPLDEAAHYIPRILDFYRERLALERNNGSRVFLLGARAEAEIRGALAQI